MRQIYCKIELPELRKYVKNDWFGKESHFDPLAQCWFIPEKYYED